MRLLLRALVLIVVLGSTTAPAVAAAPLIEEQVVTVPDSALFNGLLQLGGRLYASDPAAVVRFDSPASDLSIHTRAAFPRPGSQQFAYSALTGKVYALLMSGVAEVDPETLAVRDVVTGTFGTGGICALGDSLFVLTAGFPSQVLRYGLADYSRTGAATLASGNGHTIDTDGTSLFAVPGYGITPAWFARLDPQTLNYTSVVIPGYGYTDTMAVHGGFAWLGDPLGNVVKINTGTLSYTIIRTGPQTTTLAVFGVSVAQGYVWATHGSFPGVITRIDPVTDAVETYTLPAGQEYPDLVVPGDNGKLYVDFYQSPQRMGRFVMGEPPPEPTSAPTTTRTPTRTPTKRIPPGLFKKTRTPTP